MGKPDSSDELKRDLIERGGGHRQHLVYERAESAAYSASQLAVLGLSDAVRAEPAQPGYRTGTSSTAGF